LLNQSISIEELLKREPSVLSRLNLGNSRGITSKVDM